MDRAEFLTVLRESLEGNIPQAEMEENLRYYREYFEQSDKSDRETVEELGDPRLIARTVIDAYRASKGPMADYYTEQARNEYSRSQSREYRREEQAEGYRSERGFLNKLLGWLIALAVLVIVLVVGIVAVKVLLTVVLPVVVIVLVVKLILDHSGRG